MNDMPSDPTNPAPKPSIYVAHVSYKGVHELNCTSMIDVVAHTFQTNRRVILRSIYNDALISRSRSRILSHMLYPDMPDTLVMVDHDLQFRPDDLFELADHAHAEGCIMGIPFALRGTPLNWVGRTLKGDNKPTVGHDTITEVQFCGTLLAVSASTLAKIRDFCLASDDPDIRIYECHDSGRLMEQGFPHFWDFMRPCHLFDPDKHTTEYLSEEWAFMHRAKAAGIPTKIWHQPVVHHFGMVPFQLPVGPQETSHGS